MRGKSFPFSVWEMLIWIFFPTSSLNLVGILGEITTNGEIIELSKSLRLKKPHVLSYTNIHKGRGLRILSASK